jgi:hypothetical protein
MHQGSSDETYLGGTCGTTKYETNAAQALVETLACLLYYAHLFKRSKSRILRQIGIYLPRDERYSDNCQLNTGKLSFPTRDKFSD